MFFGVPSSVNNLKHSVTELETPKNMAAALPDRDDTATSLHCIVHGCDLIRAPPDICLCTRRVYAYDTI